MWTILFVLLASLILLGPGCERKGSVEQTRTIAVSGAVSQASASCKDCHKEIYAQWSETDHAQANRLIASLKDRSAFTTNKTISDGGAQFTLSGDDQHIVMAEATSHGTYLIHRVEMILGSRPLWQPLVAAPGGRWQPTDLAFDVNRHQWFNVFGQENRQRGEWGHWTGRGMNWNSMCAQCHMTGYRKGYDSLTDGYNSSWVEQGIGCIQCHGPMAEKHFSLPKNYHHEAGITTGPFFGDRFRMMQTCAPCHARNEALTEVFQPGDNYYDHYRPELPVSSSTYYPDGQQRDEDFNWTSVLLSRMGGHGGVTCFDCHDPHSTKTTLPVAGNILCLQCHATPGRIMPNGVQAIPIEPLSHSHHTDMSRGNSCIACHMPTTNYMQRAPRHDHGGLKPDPLLTKELGIPNACNRCHTDKSTEWAITSSESWYGSKLNSRQRTRTRAIAAAQAGNPSAKESLLSLLSTEDIPAWKATYLELLSSYTDDPSVLAVATRALTDPEPIVRSSAVKAVTGSPRAKDILGPLLNDPTRLVRLDAAWALSKDLASTSTARRELDAYLNLALDQPTGRLRLGQDLANRGMLSKAASEMEIAAKWDPNSPGISESYGIVLHALGSSLVSAEQFAHAAELLPNDASSAFRAALSYAEVGRSAEVERFLSLSLARDPRFARAWYNLGLLQAQSDRLSDARKSLQKAESLDPSNADYPYALATVLVRIGERRSAHEAVQRSLQLNPNNSAARHLLNFTQ